MHLHSTASTVVLLKTLWSNIKKMLGIRGFLTHTPLWQNLSYKEVLKLNMFQDWKRAGLRYIFQLNSQILYGYTSGVCPLSQSIL